MISDFTGLTFVAFMDISGFKHFMKKGKAGVVLDNFYNTGYHVIEHQEEDDYIVNGIFVSDCGVLYIDKKLETLIDKKMGLKKLLKIIKIINRSVFITDPYREITLTTSVAFGEFTYKDKKISAKIAKSAFHGNPYVCAFLDNEKAENKMSPGQCRIIIEDEKYKIKLPSNIVQDDDDEIFKFIREDGNYFYYYWMTTSPENIEEIKEKYKEAEQIKFEKYKEILDSYH